MLKMVKFKCELCVYTCILLANMSPSIRDKEKKSTKKEYSKQYFFNFEQSDWLQTCYYFDDLGVILSEKTENNFFKKPCFYVYFWQQWGKCDPENDPKTKIVNDIILMNTDIRVSLHMRKNGSEFQVSVSKKSKQNKNRKIPSKKQNYSRDKQPKKWCAYAVSFNNQ